MPNEEEKIANFIKMVLFVLTMLLLGVYFDHNTITIVLLCLIYAKI